MKSATCPCPQGPHPPESCPFSPTRVTCSPLVDRSEQTIIKDWQERQRKRAKKKAAAGYDSDNDADDSEDEDENEAMQVPI